MLERLSICFARFVTTLCVLTLAAVCGSPAFAVLIVDDQWRDTNRNQPTTAAAAGPHSENGVDADGDGDIESVWYRSGTSGTMAVTQPGGGAAINGSPNVLRTNTVTGTSASWTTYFTPDASEVNLASAGDKMTVTWVFTPITVNAGSTSATGLRLAVVDATTAGRVTTDATPGNDTYAGYAMFMQMRTTLTATNPFRLHERTAPGTASALLSATGSWTALDNEEGVGVTGYTSDVEYTFEMSFTRTATNSLEIAASMTGGSVGGDGTLNVSFEDVSPNSFKFDTFAIRPSTLEDSAAFFETSLFRVEFTSAVPEASSFLLVGLVGMLTAGVSGLRRRRAG